MTDTTSLITRLSSEANAPLTLLSPCGWAARLIVVLMLYAVGAQWAIGLRPDLAVQWTRPAFVAEIMLLLALLLSSSVASVLAMYPDAYQKPRLLRLPYWVAALLVGLLVVQLFMQEDPRMVMPAASLHAIECVLCIAAVALIPSIVIFILLRKGASVRQFQSGAFAVLAAAAIGCLVVRLAEDNDSLLHLVSWHYVPTLLFATVGGYVGKQVLKW